MAHRTQVHKEGRNRHQHLHLHGIGSKGGSAFLLCLSILACDRGFKNLQEKRDEEQKDVFEGEWGG